ncbi:pyridoxamine 5'-phosphate oxidase family protein [Planctomycetota bacterium]
MGESIAPEVMRHLGKLAISSLATIKEDAPTLRTVTIINQNGRFWFATHASSRKASQIKENPKVSFLQPLQEGENQGYVRVDGEAVSVSDVGVKKEIGDCAGFIEKYWSGVEDPNYALYEIKPESVVYLKPGEMEEQPVDWPVAE